MTGDRTDDERDRADDETSDDAEAVRGEGGSETAGERESEAESEAEADSDSESEAESASESASEPEPEPESDAESDSASASGTARTENDAERPTKARKKKKKKPKSATAGDDARAAEDVDDAGAAPEEASDAPPAEPKRDVVPARPPRRSPLSYVRGGAIAAVGLVTTFLLMANEDQVPHGPLFGMLAVFVGVGGLLDVFGLWTLSPEGRRSLRDTALFPTEGEPIWMSPALTVPVALLILLIGAYAGGYDGLPIVITVALAALLPSAIRRPALLLFVVASGILLPLLGVYGLWDPWETHYGEVAREMLARDDWISLWWAQEDWFWSKPILIFWIEALSMGAMGVDYLPDANPLHPEWAIRLPHYFLTMGAIFAVYALVSRVYGKRAGLVSGIVLATMPHFFFLSHQAITDMPFVANMTIAVCMLGLAVSDDPSREVRRFGLGPITVSARTLVIGALSVVVLPQVLYLISRNVTFTAELPPFGWHTDVFLSGSAGNHGVPGNSAVHNVEPYLDGLVAQPVVWGLGWLLGYALLLLIPLRKESRAQSLCMFAFYLFCGLAFMAKGIPGFALPGLVALFFLIGARRWDLLLEGRLRVGGGILTVLIVGLPWYVAMFVRHGPPFTERLIVHDHINRLTAGVHGDTGSIEYFVEQMGYGLFPWIALAPLALAAWLAPAKTDRGTDAAEAARRDVLILVALWLASAFTLFSAMTTKFHHYIFPVVPPAAILVGLALHRMLRAEAHLPRWRTIVATVLAALAPLPAILGVAGLYGDPRGIVPAGLEDAAATDWVLKHPWPTWSAALLIVLGLGLLAGAAALTWDREVVRRELSRSTWTRGAMTTGLFAAPPILALVGRDLSWITDARPYGYERLIHLFVYNYGRPWPTELDYRPILTGFAIVAVGVVLLAAVKPIRDVALRAFLGVAILFAVWALDVYIIDLSPHWGQRELVQRYYEERASADEPLIAYQMNWKGENFYTGNRVHVFVQLDNQALRTWANEHRGQTVYVLTEAARLSGLRGALGNAVVDQVTDERFNNKFILVRARLEAAPRPGRQPELD